jgi:hypothetical protein
MYFFNFNLLCLYQNLDLIDEVYEKDEEQEKKRR